MAETDLPPQPGRVPTIGTSPGCACRRPDKPRVLLCLTLTIPAILAGCKAPSVARHNRGTPTATVASQASVGAELDQRLAAQTSGDEPVPPAQSDAAPAPKPRRLIPEWLRLGGDKEPVPLPTTPISDERPAVNGPVEEFQ
ncbi:MAG: hypothetical protein JNG89_17720 [Planctomycetaceae bacterium]|nr:hypothetical protein [Planctomycetaceae bacterium]